VPLSCAAGLHDHPAPVPGVLTTLSTAGPRAGQSAGEAEFRLAVADLEAGLAQERAARPELAFEGEPAPRRLAPYAAAIAASVLEGDTEIGWGKFVLLYDPAGQAGWAGQFRIIAYVRAELDPEIAADPLIAEVGWSWLLEALDARATGYGQTSGTVTRVVTEGFGSKQDEPVSTGFELRASWSPAVDGGAGGSGADVGRVGDGADDGVTGDSAGGGAGRSGADHGRVGDLGADLGGSDLGEAGHSRDGGARPALDGHVAAWCDALCTAAGLPPLGVSALRPAGRRPQ
jgi:hypothetical protein